MAYLMVEPGRVITANKYIQDYLGVYPEVTPTEEEIAALQMDGVVKYYSTMLEYNAGVKVSGSIAKASADVKQKIAIFTFERTNSISKSFPKGVDNAHQHRAAWVYGSGFRIILNRMSAETSASTTLAAFAAEATLGKSSVTIEIQQYGGSNLMPAIPASISGFSKFDVETLRTLEDWIDKAKSAIGDGWGDKTKEEQQKIIKGTKPQLIGVDIASSEENLFNSIDQVTLFCLWRFVYGDTLEKTLHHLQKSNGEAIKRTKQFPNLFTEANVREVYRNFYTKYGALTPEQKDSMSNNAILLKAKVPDALKMQSHQYVAVYRTAT